MDQKIEMIEHPRRVHECVMCYRVIDCGGPLTSCNLMCRCQFQKVVVNGSGIAMVVWCSRECLYEDKLLHTCSPRGIGYTPD